MIRRCSRCNGDFVARQPEDYHCGPCEAAVRALVSGDARRHASRFARPKEMAR